MREVFTLLRPRFWSFKNGRISKRKGGKWRILLLGYDRPWILGVDLCHHLSCLEIFSEVWRVLGIFSPTSSFPWR